MHLVTHQNKPMNAALVALLAKPPQDNVLIFKFNLGDLIEDKELIERAADICKKLNSKYRLLLNAVLWDYDRLKAFITAPSSLAGHHSEKNGNFRHTIEVAEQLIQLCATRKYINQDLIILTALLHDVGKANEYDKKFDGTLKLSERGSVMV